MLYVEWDGVVAYLECWAGTLKNNSDLLAIPEVVECSLNALRHLLAYETTHPLLLLMQFRSLQTGLVVIDKDQTVFQAFVRKIFSCVGFLGESTDKYHLSRNTVNTRNLITTCFVRLCEAQPTLLAPHLEQLFSDHYLSLVKNDVLVYAEKCNFIESFFILSRTVHNLQQQSVFLGQLLQEPQQLLTELSSAASSVQSLVSYLCLDKEPSDPSYQTLHRYKLCFVVHIVALVLKRSAPGLAQTHPSYSHIMPFMEKFIFPLLMSIYQLWASDSVKLFSTYFKTVSDLHKFEKDTILGRTMLRRPESDDYGELGNVRMNLAAAHEGCVSGISRCFGVFGFKHLSDVGLVQLTLHSVMTGIEHLNLLRLRVLIRFLMIPIVTTLSKSEQDWRAILLPLLSHIGAFTFTTGPPSVMSDDVILAIHLHQEGNHE